MKRFKLIYLIPIFSILASLALGATIRQNITLTSFNAGEMSPLMEGRVDFAKYKSGARTLQNMIVRAQGPVTRRPGTKYIATVKDSNDPVRIIPFEYSTTDAYVIEMGDDYLRFYRNGAQVLDGATAYEVNSPWDANDLFEIQFVQDAQTMRFVHPDYAPYKLTRNSASHTDWTLAAIDFNDGPFLDENDEESYTITADGVTGDVNLVADANIFDANHVGALWQITHLVDSNTVSGRFWGAWTAVSGDVAAKADEDGDGTCEANSTTVTVWEHQEYTVTTGGDWSGLLKIQRSYDGGTTWNTVKAFAYTRNGNVLYTGMEEEDAVYRLRMEDQVVTSHNKRHGEGECDWTLSTDTFFRHGVVEITAVTDANNAAGTVKTELASTDATWRWAEGVWSTYRGFPRTIEHHEQRCCYGGTASWPQTIWASVTSSQDSDYDDFDAGLGDAADAWTYVLPGMNPIQWLKSREYLMVGTTAAVGRLGSPDKPIDPTWPPTYRTQSANGCAYMQPVHAVDAVLYVERGGQSIREVTYTYASDSYVAPDMTILAEHIARGGITQIDFAERPDPILWCVRADGVLLSFTYQKSHEVLAWAEHITGQDPNDMNDWDDFESVAVIPGTSNRADGTARNDDEVWVVVKRTVDSNEVRYIEQFQSLDWGDDPNYCWFVDCAGYGTSAGAGTNTRGANAYPTLQELTAAEIPDAPAKPADTELVTPISITDRAGLAAMHPGHHYSIGNDIDLIGSAWTPLSWNSAEAIVIEGNGYTISNMTISASTTNYQGFISQWQGAGGGEIRNLNFANCSVTAQINAGILAGSIVSTGSVTLSNIDFTSCTVRARDATGAVAGGIYIGLNGYIYDCNVISCTATESDADSPSQICLFCGHIGAGDDVDTYGVYVSNCHVLNGTSTVTGDHGSMNALFIGQVNGGAITGTPNLHFYDCSCTGNLDITGTDAGAGTLTLTGTFLASGHNVQLVSCTSDANITTHTTGSPTLSISYMGGFAGRLTEASDAIGCSWTGAISVTDDGTTVACGKVGGFAGTIGDNTPDFSSGTHLLRCYSTGGITIAEDTGVLVMGGFSGYMSNVGGIHAERCFATGDITITGNVGVTTTSDPHILGGFTGVIGIDTSAEAGYTYVCEDCYTWTSTQMQGTYPSDNMELGGFVGQGYYEESGYYAVKNCYVAQTNTATGSGLSDQLQVTDHRSGFGGNWILATNVSIPQDTSGVFYDTETSGATSSVWGDGNDTDWLQTQSNFEAAGWDFNDIWYMPDGGSDTWTGATHAANEVTCVYADGRPIGTFTVDANGVLDLDANYKVVIAGLNYYSILETMPLVSEETMGRPTAIKSVVIDFHETMGTHVGSDMDHSADWKFFERNYLSGSARDPNDGTVALPYKGNTMATGDVVRIYGTANYNGIWTLAADTNNVELRISDTYAAESFDGTETVDPNEGIEPYTGFKGPAPFLRGMTREPVVYLWEWQPIPMTVRSITANMEVTFE